MAVVGQLRRDHSRLPLSYVEAVQSAGGNPKVISTFELLPEEQPPAGLAVAGGVDPEDASVLEGAAGLLLPGGGDIDPAWYGRPPHPKTIRISHRRDRFELSLIEAAMERDMPVLAICHGMQLLNVHYGRTLNQHLADKPRFLDHDRDHGMPTSDTVHQLKVKDTSLLTDILGTTTEVNSHHHQGVDLLAPQLEPVAWAEDGVLEAVTGREHSWVVGVQWHPEAMVHAQPQQKGLFDSFVTAVEDYAGKKLGTSLSGRTRGA